MLIKNVLRILNENQSANTINSRITELLPCVLYYVNNKKKLNIDTSVKNIITAIDKNFGRVPTQSPFNVFEFAGNSGDYKAYTLAMLEGAENDKLKQDKIKQAINILNKLIDDFGTSAQLYWTAKSKPADSGAGSEDKGDIFVFANNSWTSISLKAGAKNSTPPFANPSVKSFLSVVTGTDENTVSTILYEIGEKLFKKFYKKSFNKISADVFLSDKERRVNGLWWQTIKKTLLDGNKDFDKRIKYAENLVNKIYMPARGELVKNIVSAINDTEPSIVAQGLAYLLLGANENGVQRLTSVVWHSSVQGVEDKTGVIQQVSQILNSSNLKIKAAVKSSSAFTLTISGGKKNLQHVLLFEVRASHSGQKRFKSVENNEVFKSVNQLDGLYTLPFLDKVAFKIIK